MRGFWLGKSDPWYELSSESIFLETHTINLLFRVLITRSPGFAFSALVYMCICRPLQCVLPGKNTRLHGEGARPPLRLALWRQANIYNFNLSSIKVTRLYPFTVYVFRIRLELLAMHLVELSVSFFFLSKCSHAISWEHVVLADCINSGSIRLSQMAYYSLGITANPEAVAVVPTPHNKTAIWANRNRNSTSSDFVEATFPDGVFFRANLSTEKDLAGIGHNNYKSFSCWKYKVPRLYSWYRDVNCDAVYDCNHQAAAGDDKALNATAVSTAPDPPETAPSTPRPEDKKSNDIALGVGVGLGLPSIIVAIIGVLVARNKKAKHSSQSAGTNSNGAGSAQPGVRVPNSGAASATVVPQGPPSVTQGSAPAPPNPNVPQSRGGNRNGVAVPNSGPRVPNAGVASAAIAPQGSSSITQGSSSVAQGSSSVAQGSSSVAQGSSSAAQGSSSLTRGLTPTTQKPTATRVMRSNSNRIAIANPGPTVSKTGVTSAAIIPQGSSSITQGSARVTQKPTARSQNATV